MDWRHTDYTMAELYEEHVAHEIAAERDRYAGWGDDDSAAILAEQEAEQFESEVEASLDERLGSWVVTELDYDGAWLYLGDAVPF